MATKKVKLSDFIKESIAEILRGLEESESDKYRFGLLKDTGIEFDVTVAGKNNRSSKVGLEILTLGGASTQGHQTEEDVQRLRFRVSVLGKKLKTKKK